MDVVQWEHVEEVVGCGVFPGMDEGAGLSGHDRLRDEYAFLYNCLSATLWLIVEREISYRTVCGSGSVEHHARLSRSGLGVQSDFFMLASSLELGQLKKSWLRVQFRL